jgi:hypothetical protein
MRRPIVRLRRLAHCKNDRSLHVIGAQLAGPRSYQLIGELGDGVPNARRGQRGDEIVEDWLETVDRIASAELGSKREGKLDVVSIRGQMASVGAPVQHLADHTAEYQPNGPLDRFAAVGLRLLRTVRRLMQRDGRHPPATVEPR